jgi:hypothetical protein
MAMMIGSMGYADLGLATSPILVFGTYAHITFLGLFDELQIRMRRENTTADSGNFAEISRAAAIPANTALLYLGLRRLVSVAALRESLRLRNSSNDSGMVALRCIGHCHVLQPRSPHTSTC